MEKSSSEKSGLEKMVFRAGVSPVDSNKKIGPIRTHMYAYAFARSESRRGKDASIIFRVDDTDKSKHNKEKAFEIYQFFSKTLGFDFDVTPENSHERIGQSVFQSERQDIYAEYLEELYEKGVAFVDTDSGLVLFDIQKFIEQYSEFIEIEDIQRGDISFALSENIKNGRRFFPLMRSDKSALYHLASVVDDATFGVTHVVRGQDKLSIAEFQEMVRIVLGLQPKKYLHTPLLLNEKGGLLSGAVKFDDFIRKGILPQAIISYMISSGYGDPEAIHPSVEGFVRDFDFNEIHRNNAKFDEKRLQFVNKKIIREITPEIFSLSLDIYLQKMQEDALLEIFQNDNSLRKLLSDFRRNPEESVGLLRALVNPHFEQISSEEKEVVHRVILAYRNNDGYFPKESETGIDRRVLLQAMRWILTGKKIFPDIENVFGYFQEKGMLESRIRSAEQGVL